VTKGARISKVDIEDTKVAESILYSINLQMDIGNIRGTSHELQFVHPVSEWRPIQTTNTLPSSRRSRSSSNSLALHGSSPYYIPPEISLTLNGPMELYFPQATTELVVKTPRFVDVGYVDRLILKEGANLTLTGSSELRLRESLAIYPTMSIDDNRLVINTKETPKFNVYGHRIEIKNNEGEELKVKKKFSSVLEVTPTKTTSVRPINLPFEIPLNDSRIETIKYALQQWSLVNNVLHQPVIRKLSSGSSMEAVVSFLIPLSVEDNETGTTTSYDVVVVQGSNHREAQVISVAPAKVRNQINFNPELAANGTLPDAMERLQSYLNSNGRLAM